MSRRIPIFVLLGVLIVSVACSNKKVSNPIANVDSKQPDKVLFDRAMAAMKHNQFEVARMSLQTLINTYPDSEFLARAKLSLGDSFYAEGGSSNLAEAEAEYNDFITFFPNMPEAAEAQVKIANIHFNEMEKPDRDYTHAMRAEEEYRRVIQQYPDNAKMVEVAKQKLRIVQEILAEREYRVGKFYYMQQSYPAAIARLKSMVDAYPLYSKADETLFTLGQSYEAEITRLDQMHPTTAHDEAQKAEFLDKLTASAAEAYDRILTRYPVMDRARDAKARLEALHQTVPHPTKAMVAQNQAEENSRRDPTFVQSVRGDFSHHPETLSASRVGEPTLTDPKEMSAVDVIRQAAAEGQSTGNSTGNSNAAITVIGQGAPPASDPVPHSDGTTPDANAAGASANLPTPDAAATTPPAGNPASVGADGGELKPDVPANAPADPNELKPNVADGDVAAPPPQQVNEIQSGASNSAQPGTANADNNQPLADDSVFSSSKKNKKKGLKKVVPF